MLDQQIRPDSPVPDRSTRTAALVAAAVAVPVAVIAAMVIFSHLRESTTAAPPSPPPAASAPAALSTAPVTMAAPLLSARAETVCRALVSQLPMSVRGLPQRPVLQGTEQNAAFGDPAITVACGTAAPTVPAESVLMTMDRVCWFTEQRADATVWTAIDREIPVQVTVPSAYAAPAQWANEFSVTIGGTVPLVKGAPSGCA
jgi:hypothetical protein